MLAWTGFVYLYISKVCWCIHVCFSKNVCVCVSMCWASADAQGRVEEEAKWTHATQSAGEGAGGFIRGSHGLTLAAAGHRSGGLQESLDIGGWWGLGVQEPNEPPRSLSPGLPSRPTSRISGRSRKINSAPLWSRLLLCFSFSTLPFSTDLINHACNTHTHTSYFQSFFLSVFPLFLLFSRQNVFQTKHDASHKGWKSICVTAPLYGDYLACLTNYLTWLLIWQ